MPIIIGSPTTADAARKLSKEEVQRYSRHLIMPEVGMEGQLKLARAKVLMIGAGGLGAPLGLYLAAAGVGRLGIVDFDKVDYTNLQRQIVHRTHSIGRTKVDSARATLAEINPEARVVALAERVQGARLDELVDSADVVVDGCDNFATRHAVNRACVKFRKPLVSGAAVRFDGQVAVFDLRDAHSPCYHCLFPESGENEDVRCAVMGVFAPLVGIVGSIQAAETLKVISGAGETLVGRLLLVDALAMQTRIVRFARDAACTVCAA